MNWYLELKIELKEIVCVRKNIEKEKKNGIILQLEKIAEMEKKIENRKSAKKMDKIVKHEKWIKLNKNWKHRKKQKAK